MANVEQANNKASELEKIAIELKSAQNILTSSKNMLKSGWSGAAASNFIKGSESMQSEITNCISNINKLANTVRSAAKNASAGNVKK